MADFNGVDYAFIGVFVGSIIAGLMRGVIKEVISVLTWAAAFIVASLFSSRLAAAFSHSDHVQSAISSANGAMGMNATQSVSYLALGGSFVLLFVGTLIIGSLLNRLISYAAEGQGISIANRLLGGIFGLGRGFLINLVVIFLVQLAPAVAQQPMWTSSQLVTAYQPAVAWLSEFVQPGFESLKTKVGETIHDVGDKVTQGVSSGITN